MARSVTQAITETIGPDAFDGVTSPQTKMLLALGATGRHVYEGTVPPAVVARRRAANKRARIARRAHR